MSRVAVRYIVDDVAACVPFYERLGFSVRARPADTFAVLECDGLRLLLSDPSAGGGAAQRAVDGRHPTPGGWNRIQVDVDDFERLVHTLQSEGATFRTEAVAGLGGRQVLVEDPSGNAVEVFEAGAP